MTGTAAGPPIYAYLCFTKTGCGSDKAVKSELFPVLSLTFHYLCYTKIGCGSGKAGKNELFPALSLTFHYLYRHRTITSTL